MDVNLLETLERERIRHAKAKKKFNASKKSYSVGNLAKNPFCVEKRMFDTVERSVRNKNPQMYTPLEKAGDFSVSIQRETQRVMTTETTRTTNTMRTTKSKKRTRSARPPPRRLEAITEKPNNVANTRLFDPLSMSLDRSQSVATLSLQPKQPLKHSMGIVKNNVAGLFSAEELHRIMQGREPFAGSALPRKRRNETLRQIQSAPKLTGLFNPNLTTQSKQSLNNTNAQSRSSLRGSASLETLIMSMTPSKMQQIEENNENYDSGDDVSDNPPLEGDFQPINVRPESKLLRFRPDSSHPSSPLPFGGRPTSPFSFRGTSSRPYTGTKDQILQDTFRQVFDKGAGVLDSESSIMTPIPENSQAFIDTINSSGFREQTPGVISKSPRDAPMQSLYNVPTFKKSDNVHRSNKMKFQVNSNEVQENGLLDSKHIPLHPDLASRTFLSIIPDKLDPQPPVSLKEAENLISLERGWNDSIHHMPKPKRHLIHRKPAEKTLKKRIGRFKKYSAGTNTTGLCENRDEFESMDPYPQLTIAYDTWKREHPDALKMDAEKSQISTADLMSSILKTNAGEEDSLDGDEV